MKYFVVPADFKKETICEYEKLNSKYKDAAVVETYGNITIGKNFGSGRVLNQLPEVDLLDLQNYIDFSKKRNIEFSYTLNIPYMGNKEFTREGISEIKEFLKILHKIGVRVIILSLPSLFEIVKSLEVDFKIKASTICHITNANKAAAYKRMGFDRIVVDESIHWDFSTLRNIVAVFGEEVEVIANTMCHRNCIYRNFHYNETGADSSGIPNNIGIDFFEHKCLLQRYAGVSEILKLGWIRPEDTKYYNSVGIRYFKLQGRQHVAKGGHIRAVEYYLKGDFDGNLMELLDMFNTRYSFKVHLDNKKLDGFIRPFYEGKHVCRNYCSTCHYCDAFAGKCINIEEAEGVIRSARMFYNEYNKFKKMIHAAGHENEEKVRTDEIKVDFDLT